jgi:hypothetical protein
LTSRRIVAGAVFVGLLLFTTTVSSILVGQHEYNDGNAGGLVDIAALPIHLRDLVFLGHVDPEGPLGGVAGAGGLAVVGYLVVLAVALTVLFARYREAEK